MDEIKKLQLMADKLRIHSITSTTAAGSGHPTTCMSCAEIMSTLFFSELGENDEFLLSKGHAAPILWAAYAEAGFLPIKELANLRKINSALEGHPTPNMKLVKVATGSLGQGLSAGVGISLAQKLGKAKSRAYVLMGDGECAEGAVWEAANSAAFYKLNNLCVIVDVNRLGQSQQTMHGHDIEAYKKKFIAFGWDAVIVNGHDVRQLLNAYKKSKASKKPTAIIAKTFKGKGVSFLENKEGWHGKALNEEQMKEALAEIGKADITLLSKVKYHPLDNSFSDFKLNRYTLGENIATREAFGNALVALGKSNKNVVVLDGDVKNSTMTERFFKSYHDRSFESFIAEQNMAGMAIGFSAMGYAPFVATFAAFLTRAHDFIRMAYYSRANIKFVGSHVGVSIGQDGASQMGLEDISMFLSIPNSLILYPCDAASTEFLVKEMARHKGISYLRTTRGGAPVIYDSDERFPVGGLKVLKKSENDSVLVIGAGVTVHEALKAYNTLKKNNIFIRVIDLYSVQPLDKKTLERNAIDCNYKVIVAEDHYYGGIGAVVSSAIGKLEHLYVKDMPRSGKPEELRKMFGIDADSIVNAVNRLVK